MRVVQVETVEDCFDGSFIKEISLSEAISVEFIKKMGEGNSLEYFPDFPRPFFRIEKKNFYQIKGVLKSRSIRVIFNRQCNSACIESLVSFINNLF